MKICRRSPRGNVDWNRGGMSPILAVIRRSPRGNVDWNFLAAPGRIRRCVVPHEGTWIEIEFRAQKSYVLSSFPTRERGLKSGWAAARGGRSLVVPHEGTWIEIPLLLLNPVSLWVVPHEGTWIEIVLVPPYPNFKLSFPTRERGLKSWKWYETGRAPAVVPHEGTWIEMVFYSKWDAARPSFPTRERGLKLCRFVFLVMIPRRSPRGNVDWNLGVSAGLADTVSRSPRGNVDWNGYALPQPASIDVVPHEGTWIEIGKGKGRSNKDLVVPHEGTWIEICWLG